MKELWRDPVWSKVIAAGIIASVTWAGGKLLGIHWSTLLSNSFIVPAWAIVSAVSVGVALVITVSVLWRKTHRAIPPPSVAMKTIDQTPITVALPAPKEPELTTILRIEGPNELDILLNPGETTAAKPVTSGVFVYAANRKHLDVRDVRVMVTSASSFDSVKGIFRAPVAFKSAVVVLADPQLRAGFKTQSAKWFLRLCGDHLETGGTNGMGPLDWPTADPSTKHIWLLKLLVRAEGMPDWETFLRVEWSPGNDDILMAKSSDLLPAVNVGLTVALVWHEKESPTTPPNIKYRNKVRIAIQNASSAPITLNSYWIANGKVSLQLPKRIVYRKERQEGSWHKGDYASEEKETVFLDPGWVATTWIGLFDPLDDMAFGLIRDSHGFGTLACKIAIGSHEEEIRIPI